MGHREDLLEGAKKCLLDIGYANTTARDIVAASGTNLASIGYHFGSKDALMTQAIIELLGEWGGKFEQPKAAADLGYRDRFRAIWANLILACNSDPKLALASFENFTHVARRAELTAIIADGQQEGRMGLAEEVSDPTHPPDEKTRQAVGGVMLAITTGLIAQRLVDPERSPSADDVLLAFQYVADALGCESKKRK